MRRPLLIAAAILSPVWALGACQTSTYCPAPDACHASGTRDGSGACVNALLPEGTQCDDDNPCTESDRCTQGVCGGAAVTCPATACQVAAACSPPQGCGAPQDLPEGSACDDHSLCTNNDHCVSGACQGTLVAQCTGVRKDACHLPNACDPNSGQCVDTAMGGPCDPNLMPSPTVGCSYNVYGALVNVGNANVNLLLDTGSTTLAVANANCPSCTNIAPRYTPSSSGILVGTAVSSTYLDGTSWKGVTYLDNVTPLGTADTVKLRFAAITSQNGFFRDFGCTLDGNTPNFYQGILGLGSVGNAVKGTDSYTDTASHVMPANAFSMLMCNPNGLIWWGGYDPVTVQGAPNFTPFVSSNAYYEVNVTSLGVGTQSIASHLANVIVDSGTSLLLLPQSAVTALADVLGTNATFINNFGSAQNPNSSAQSFFTSGHCPAASATPDELDAALPPFTMTFPNAQGGFTVQLKATQSYIQPMAIDSQGGLAYCSGVMASPSSGGQTIVILGASGMIGNIFIFDRDNKQLGIAATNACAEM